VARCRRIFVTRKVGHAGTLDPMATGVLVLGIRLMDMEKLPSVINNIKQGSLGGFDDGQGVAIGRRLADQLSLRAGDNITLVAPRGAVTPMGTTPRIKVYKVAAVFEIGMSEYDGAMVFMPLKEAQAYFNRAGDVTAIEVYTDNPDKVAQAQAKPTMLGWFVGQVMKETGGKANPQSVNEELKRKLGI
jgi:lipoprotein-releasing system permease protein